MTHFLLPLDSPEATLPLVGGKGANLAELVRAGFRVPPGFLVTVVAYRAFVDANGIGEPVLELARRAAPDDPAALERASEQIGALFAGGAIPSEVAAQLRQAYQELSGPGDPAPVAVRSSATAEDLPDMSFAGQQDTYLNIVGENALLDAVKSCWASLWTARAIGYRQRNQIAPDDVALAVVVQTLVPAEASGVLFTANPLTGSRQELVIDASFGLGEAVVSGQVEPDHYVVRAGSGQIVARRLGAKALAVLPRAGGGTDHIAQHAAGRQALPDEHIRALARIAEQVAAHFGAPQDIEWAWAGGHLHLLQSRPITSLYPLPVEPAGDGSEPRVFFSFNALQGVTDPFTPLGGDALRLIVGGFLRLFGAEARRDQLVRAPGGRLYVDVTDNLRDRRLRRLLFTALANGEPAAHQILQRLLDQGRLSEQRLFGMRQLPHVARVLRRVVARASTALYAPRFTRARALVQAEAAVEQVRQAVAATRSLAALLDRFEADMARLPGELLIRVMAVAVPGIALMALIDRMLAAWLGEEEGAVLALLRGLPGNVTTEMDLRLWAATAAIRAEPQARQALVAAPPEALAEAYQRGALPPVAQRAVEAFLCQYGIRAVAEIDIGRPRWRDDPAHVFQAIAGYLRLDAPDLAPDRQFERGQAASEQAASDFVERVRHTRAGGPRARLLRLAISRARALVGVRESPKFLMVKVIDIYRSALLAHGRDMAARGALAEPDDIFFVPLAELRRYADGQPIDLHSIVRERLAAYARERKRQQMPRVLLSSGEAFYEGLADPTATGLSGDAVSPGVVEGLARVVLDPRGARLEPGEILVCPATDPGWTPLFLTAGGLVMEIGGMITHGSVVAREYGIPAVVGVHGATVRLRTGQRIRVDGSHGQITLLDEH